MKPSGRLTEVECANAPSGADVDNLVNVGSMWGTGSEIISNPFKD